MDSWKERFLAFGLLWLRALTGLSIAFFHGYGKVFGGQMGRFAEGVAKMGFPLPGFFAWASGLTELAGGVLIALGLGTRMAAFFVFINMSVAAFIRHGPDPFSVKERALAYWVIAVALIFTGPGPLSLDTLLRRRRSGRK